MNVDSMYLLVYVFTSSTGITTKEIVKHFYYKVWPHVQVSEDNGPEEIAEIIDTLATYG